MDSSSLYEDGMQPMSGDTTVKLPMTLNYNGGRGDRKRGNIVSVAVVSILSIIISVGVAKNESMEWYWRILLPLVILYAALWFIRMFVLMERTVSDSFESLKKVNNEPSSRSFWGIYEISPIYPYVCRFIDNKVGIFVLFEKDVIVGKDVNTEGTHFDAIADTYNAIWSSNVTVCHLDYMDNVGNDDRLSEMYRQLDYCETNDLRSLMYDIYRNLEEEMSDEYTSYDVYAIVGKCSEAKLWYYTSLFCSDMLDGNYISYKVMDDAAVRGTCQAVMNLHEFSAVDACDELVRGTTYRGLVPIRVKHEDGTVEVLNKTQEEIRFENMEKVRVEEEARNSKKRKKRSEPSIDTEVTEVQIPAEVPNEDKSDSELDLFQ